VHWCLTHFLFDGHHKMEAATRSGMPVTLLSLLAVDDGLAGPEDLARPARVEPPGELGEVLDHAEARVPVAGIARTDFDRQCDQQPLDLGHRRDQAIALGPAQRLDDRGRQIVGATVELGPLRQARVCEPHGPDASIGLMLINDDEACRLQRPQQPAHVAGVEIQPGSQRPDISSIRADLPQQTCLTERPVAREEPVVEAADPLGDGAVEPPDLVDHCSVHSLTVVRE
jgi:hypothetical protein